MSINKHEIIIKEVQTRKDMDLFVNLPWSIYKKDPKWIPPLKFLVKRILSPGHPFFDTVYLKSWIAIQDNKVVGRISANVNKKFLEDHSSKCGFFGHFESIPDPIVANLLFKKAETFLKKEGMSFMRGPVNPSMNYEQGLLVRGFNEEPMLMTTYNPSYYEDYFKGNGLYKLRDFFAYSLTPKSPLPKKLIYHAEQLENSTEIKFRTLNKKKWKKEVDKLFDVYNLVREDHINHTPMTEKEFYDIADTLRGVVDENLVIFSFVNEELAGFIIALPNYNQVLKKIKSGLLFPMGAFRLWNAKKQIDQARVITTGVIPKYRNLGLASFLYKQMRLNLISGGYKQVEMSLIQEDNEEVNRPLILMGARPNKRYRIFEKPLN